MSEEITDRETPDGEEYQNEELQSPARSTLVPKINCKENIVICLDLTAEMNSVSLRNSPNKTVFQITQQALEILVKSKLSLSRKHAFAVVAFEETAQWLQDFTSDILPIMDTLSQLTPSATQNYETCNITSLFEAIESHVELPKIDEIELPPENIIRVIWIYGRSNSTVPSFSPEGQQIFEKYMSSPYFFFDVLYVHEIANEENNCEDIYDAFCKLDDNEDCFMLEVSRSVTRFFDHMAKLVAHPLQRPRQQDIDCQLSSRYDSVAANLLNFEV